jgi:hypothetical protein
MQYVWFYYILNYKLQPSFFFVLQIFLLFCQFFHTYLYFDVHKKKKKLIRRSSSILIEARFSLCVKLKNFSQPQQH